MESDRAILLQVEVVGRDMIMEDGTRGVVLPNTVDNRLTPVVKVMEVEGSLRTVQDRDMEVDRRTTKVDEDMAQVVKAIPKVAKVKISEICTAISNTLKAKDKDMGTGTIRCHLKVLLKGTTLRKSPPTSVRTCPSHSAPC